MEEQVYDISNFNDDLNSWNLRSKGSVWSRKEKQTINFRN